MSVKELLHGVYYSELIQADNAEQTRAKAESIINQIDDAKLQYVLRQRYYKHRSIESIADELYYTPRHVRRLNKQALQKAENVYEDNRQGLQNQTATDG